MVFFSTLIKPSILLPRTFFSLRSCAFENDVVKDFSAQVTRDLSYYGMNENPRNTKSLSEERIFYFFLSEKKSLERRVKVSTL